MGFAFSSTISNCPKEIFAWIFSATRSGRALTGAYALGLALSFVVDKHPPLAFMLFHFDGHASCLLRLEFMLVLHNERAEVVRHPQELLPLLLVERDRKAPE